VPAALARKSHTDVRSAPGPLRMLEQYRIVAEEGGFRKRASLNGKARRAVRDRGELRLQYRCREGFYLRVALIAAAALSVRRLISSALKLLNR